MTFANSEEKRIEWRFFFFILFHLVCDDVLREGGREEGIGLDWPVIGVSG